MATPGNALQIFDAVGVVYVVAVVPGFKISKPGANYVVERVTAVTPVSVDVRNKTP